MSTKYPKLTESPTPSASKPSSNKKKERVPASPQSVASQVEVEDDFSKYSVVRAATGTGIFSSVFTLSLLVFFNEIRFYLYYRDYLSLNPFSNFLFSAGFIVSTLQVLTFACVLFIPSYLLQGKKIAKLAPYLISIVIQLFMLHFNESDGSVKIFAVQGWYGKFLMIKEFMMTYGAFFISVFFFVALNSAYNTSLNKIFRTFEFVDYPEEGEDLESSPV